MTTATERHHGPARQPQFTPEELASVETGHWEAAPNPFRTPEHPDRPTHYQRWVPNRFWDLQIIANRMR